jgi:hypothetical protein
MKLPLRILTVQGYISPCTFAYRFNWKSFKVTEQEEKPQFMKVFDCSTQRISALSGNKYYIYDTTLVDIVFGTSTKFDHISKLNGMKVLLD